MGNSNSGGSARHHAHNHAPQPGPESEAPSSSVSSQPPPSSSSQQTNPSPNHSGPHHPPPGYPVAQHPPGHQSAAAGHGGPSAAGTSAGDQGGPSGNRGNAGQPGGQRPNPGESNGSWFGGNGFTPYRIPPGIGCQALAQSTESQKTATIRNDVNLKRGTLKLVRDEANPGMHLVTFSFDATVPGSMCIYYLAKEGDKCSFKSMKPNLFTPVRFPFAAGLAQTFRQPSGTGVDLQKFTEAELSKVGAGRVFPLVVRSQTIPKNPPPDALDISNDPPGARLPKWVQSQMTMAVIEKHTGDEFTVKVMEQKISVNGQRYTLQEIYGIEQSGSGGNESASESGKECVICMSEPRDTTVLPCRHMCMCRECALVLRFQTNRCPICRQPVERLLEIRVPKENKEAHGEQAGSSSSQSQNTPPPPPPPPPPTSSSSEIEEEQPPPVQPLELRREEGHEQQEPRQEAQHEQQQQQQQQQEQQQEAKDEGASRSCTHALPGAEQRGVGAETASEEEGGEGTRGEAANGAGVAVG